MEPWLIFIPFLLLIIAVAVWGAYAAAQRRKELAAWCARRGFTFSADRDRSFMERYPNFDCFRKGDQDRYAYNIMTGRWGERPLIAFDYHYETVSTDSKGRRTTHSHHFSGVILHSALPLKPLFIRPEGFFDKVTEFFGHDDIDFESAEFSRKFYVRSPDRRWAYDVIHQRTMEFLLSQPTFTIEFDGPHALAFRGGTFGVAEFEQAADVIAGVLDRLPDYLKKQLQPPEPPEYQK